MNKEKTKAEVWAEIIVTVISVSITVWVMAGRPKVAAYAAFHGARNLQKLAHRIGTAAVHTEAAYWRMVAH